MKLEKWYEKAGKIFDSLVSKHDLIYHNGDDNMTFCDKTGTWALRIPGHVVLSARDESHDEREKGLTIHNCFDAAVSARDYILVKEIENGTVRGKKAVRLTNGNGVSAIVNNKYLRPFPKNADFYVKNATSPVIVSIWENAKCNIIAIVCPAMTHDFKPNNG